MAVSCAKKHINALINKKVCSNYNNYNNSELNFKQTRYCTGHLQLHDKIWQARSVIEARVISCLVEIPNSSRYYAASSV